MGTVFTVEIEAPADPALCALAWAEVDRVDHRMSSWKPDSEISLLVPGRCCPVHPDTLEVLRTSQQVCRHSGGAFDVTVAPLLRAWGLLGGQPALPSGPALAAARALVGCERYTLDPVRSCVRLEPGSSVDLGGIAKGWALDRARSALLDAGVRQAVLDLGGQLHHIGSGHRAVVLDPRNPDRALVAFDASGLSVSTSAQTERFVEIDGVRHGHILDPATGQPASGVICAAVTHPSAMIADALSTALFVRGRGGLEPLLAAYPEAGVLLLEPEGLTLAGTLQGPGPDLGKSERSATE